MPLNEPRVEEGADHFADISKVVEVGSQAQRPVDDLTLTRYACYLIVQNGERSA